MVFVFLCFVGVCRCCSVIDSFVGVRCVLVFVALFVFSFCRCLCSCICRCL